MLVDIDDPTTLIDVWVDGRGWRPTPVHRLRCECGLPFGDPGLYWDEVIPGEPFLACTNCDAQFYASALRDR